MKNLTNFQPGCGSNSQSEQALLLIKISLVICLLGVAVVARRESGWPIISWILYSGYSERYQPPKPSVSEIELRIYTDAGDVHIVKPEQILSIPYDSLSYSIVKQAFNEKDKDVSVRDASRKYLMQAISEFISTDSKIQTIEAWELSYQVEPLEVPPIEKNHPTSEVMLNRFSRENLIPSN